MKISKLFHWLYATLMFLPIIFFVPSCLYYSLNEHATNTETTTINYKYESNEVNTLDDLVEGNIYYLEFERNVDLENVSSPYSETFIYVLTGYVEIESEHFSIYTTAPLNLAIHFNTTGEGYWTVLLNNSEFEADLIYLEDIVFRYTGSQFNLFLEDNEFLPQQTDYNVIESVSVNTDDTISDKVNRAWSSIWDLPLFAWTKTSFVAAPFSYITSLFGLGSDNTLNYVFAYFVSISICWLVFDLVMYVPNLAHRWLDRSSLE